MNNVELMAPEGDALTTNAQNGVHQPDALGFEQAALDWGELEERPQITIFGRVIELDSENRRIRVYAIEGEQTPWEAETYLVFVPGSVLQAYKHEQSKIARGDCIAITGEVAASGLTNRRGEVVPVKLLHAKTMRKEQIIAPLIEVPTRKRGLR